MLNVHMFASQDKTSLFAFYLVYNGAAKCIRPALEPDLDGQIGLRHRTLPSPLFLQRTVRSSRSMLPEQTQPRKTLQRCVQLGHLVPDH